MLLLSSKISGLGGNAKKTTNARAEYVMKASVWEETLILNVIQMTIAKKEPFVDKALIGHLKPDVPLKRVHMRHAVTILNAKTTCSVGSLLLLSEG